MTDKEKVIIGLEQHMKTACMSARGQLQPVFCPYFCYSNCITTLCRDTLELLKEREPAVPKELNMYPRGVYACGACGHAAVGSNDYRAKFCPECGRALKWE